MINGVYIVRQGGVSFSYLDDGNASDTDVDLMMPFFSALDAFTNESFNAVLKGLTLEDESGIERKIYFRDNKAHGMAYKMIVITSGRSVSQKEIDSRLMQLNWAMREKNWFEFLNRGSVPPHIEREIREKIRQLFEL